MNQEQIHAIVDRSRLGDAKAFEALVSTFQLLVFRLAFRLLCDEEEAKDIVQDTFIKVWLGLDKYNPQYPFHAWLYKIACNLCYDRLRSKSRFQAETDPASLSTLAVSSSENVEQAVINNELKTWIVYFTNQLTPKQKLVFTLSDMEGLNTKEIADITQLSQEKIKSNLYLARKQIKEKLNKMQ
jgi:RNA polymerase sigma-70 factor (ECF subfamily)